MARPSKPDPLVRKEIHAYVTDKDRQEIQEKAKKAALSVSAYIARALQKAEIKAPTVPAINIEAVQQIRRIGVNLNQLTRFFNSRPDAGNALLPVRLAELEELMDRFQRKLLGWSE